MHQKGGTKFLNQTRAARNLPNSNPMPCCTYFLNAGYNAVSIHARTMSTCHISSHPIQPKAQTEAKMEILSCGALPSRVLVGAACTPPLCPSLALDITVVLVPLVVVAGNRAVVVLRPELP